MKPLDIEAMVNRFLEWKLPENFAPDGGISFTRIYNEASPFGPAVHEPVGTNLFDAQQARAMIEHLLAAPAQPAPEPAAQAAAAVPEAVERDVARLDWIIRQGDEFTCAIIVDSPGDGDYLCTGMTTVGQGKTAREAIDNAMSADRLAAPEAGAGGGK